MRRHFGGIILTMLGIVLVVSGLSPNDSSVGVVVTSCGTTGLAAVVPNCPSGHIVLKKVVKGDGTAPSGGWSVTISSSNCSFPNDTAKTYTVPSNGSVTTGELYSTQTSSQNSVLCKYTVTENKYAGFTTAYSPGRTVTLGTSTTDPGSNNRTVTITNTAATPSSSAASSSTAPSSSTHTTTAPATTSAVPTTSSAGGSGELANTGSKGVRPATVIGVLAIMAGLGLAFAGRRRPRGHHV